MSITPDTIEPAVVGAQESVVTHGPRTVTQAVPPPDSAVIDPNTAPVLLVSAIDIELEEDPFLSQKFVSKFAYVFDRWKYHYIQNSRTIATLTVANVLLTILNEFAGRSIYTAMNWATSQQAFILWDSAGNWSIHRQSMVNILMTLFLSLAGGPIHFLKEARHRFAFFAGMAVLVSILSQGAIWVLVSTTAAISMKRVVFDFFYSSTIKYSMFEFVRPWLLKHRRSFSVLFALRYSQDLALSMIRIGLLIMFGINH